MQRQVLTDHPVQTKADWDIPLPAELKPNWDAWKTGVMSKSSLGMPRCILPLNTSGGRRELHVFCDASQDAIGSVIYMKSISESGECVVTFVSAISRLAPRAATTIPRLELCAALLAAVHVYSIVQDLKIEIDEIYLYSDSMVVLGYLRNVSKCFTKYVTRRVEATLRLYDRSKWSYVPTDLNPADLATRPCTPAQLEESIWFTGPPFLTDDVPLDCEPKAHPELPESLPKTQAYRTSAPHAEETTLWTQCAARVSRWMTLVNVAKLILGRVNHRLDVARQRLGVSLAPRSYDASVKEAALFLFKSAQRDAFPTLFDQNGVLKPAVLKDLPESHPHPPSHSERGVKWRGELW